MAVRISRQRVRAITRFGVLGLIACLTRATFVTPASAYIPDEDKPHRYKPCDGRDYRPSECEDCLQPIQQPVTNCHTDLYNACIYGFLTDEDGHQYPVGECHSQSYERCADLAVEADEKSKLYCGDPRAYDRAEDEDREDDMYYLLGE